MRDLAADIAQAPAEEIDRILQAVLRRYTVLFPDWEVSTITLHRGPDRNEQLDRIISTLQSMKQIP